MLEPHGVLWLCQGSGTLEDPPVLPFGSGFGTGLKKESGHNGCIQHGLGCPVQWQAGVLHLVRSEAPLPHQLSGYDGGAPGAQSFSARPERPLQLGPVGQHDGGRLHKPPRRPEVTPLLLWAHKVTAVHVAGRLNQGLDMLSRSWVTPGDWRLHPQQGAQSGTPSWSYRAFMCGLSTGAFAPIAECAKYHFGGESPIYKAPLHP